MAGGKGVAPKRDTGCTGTVESIHEDARAPYDSRDQRDPSPLGRIKGTVYRGGVLSYSAFENLPFREEHLSGGSMWFCLCPYVNCRLLI